MTRITNQELLLSGWHGVHVGEKQWWAHPELSPNLISFQFAARIEKAFRELRERANNRFNDEASNAGE